MAAKRALALVGALALGAGVEAQPDPRYQAMAWLNTHYSAQEKGECLSSSCPVAKGWKLVSIEPTGDGILIAFSSPKAAPPDNVERFRALPAAELESQVRNTLCPYAGFEVWKMLPEPLAIRVSLADAHAGLVGAATCSRRVHY